MSLRIDAIQTKRMKCQRRWVSAILYGIDERGVMA